MGTELGEGCGGLAISGKKPINPNWLCIIYIAVCIFFEKQQPVSLDNTFSV